MGLLPRQSLRRENRLADDVGQPEAGEHHQRRPQRCPGASASVCPCRLTRPARSRRRRTLRPNTRRADATVAGDAAARGARGEHADDRGRTPSCRRSRRCRSRARYDIAAGVASAAPAPEGRRRDASCRQSRAATPIAERRAPRRSVATWRTRRTRAQRRPRRPRRSAAHADDALAVRRQRVDRQHARETRSAAAPIEQHARRVAEAPLQSGAPLPTGHDRRRAARPPPDDRARTARARGRRRTPARAGKHHAIALPLNRLQLEELVERVRPELAADARFLVAAERRQQIEAAAVDVDLSGAQPSRDLQRALGRRRPDAAGEAVDRIVGDARPPRPRCRRE